MKESPSERDLRERLGPSKFSGEGFLGDDTRPVREIISADLAILESKGIAPKIIGTRLQEIYDNVAKNFGAEVVIMPGIYGKYNESMGKIPSPFHGEGTFPKGEVILKFNDSRDDIVLTPLSIHLIKAHSFFQGKGSRYRIDPDKAADLLKVQ